MGGKKGILAREISRLNEVESKRDRRDAHLEVTNLAAERARLVLMRAVDHGVGSAAAGVALRRLRALACEVANDTAVVAGLRALASST